MNKQKILWYAKEIASDVLFFVLMLALVILVLGVAPI